MNFRPKIRLSQRNIQNIQFQSLALEDGSYAGDHDRIKIGKSEYIFSYYQKEPIIINETLRPPFDVSYERSIYDTFIDCKSKKIEQTQETAIWGALSAFPLIASAALKRR